MTENGDVLPDLPGNDNTTSNNTNALIANICEVSVLYLKVLAAFEKHCYQDGNGIIHFAQVNHVLSWLFHCDKTERHKLIFEMKRLGLIDVRAYQGIKILKREGIK